jgi:hypothetical protein
MFFAISLWLALTALGDETFHMPEPTKEINEKIALLGDDSFRVREAADQELRKMGWPALKGVYLASQTSPDPEIRLRASRIYQRYFYIASDDKDTPIPSIWFIDEKLRYPKGFKLETSKNERVGSVCKILDVPDLAKDFYDQAATRNEKNPTGYSQETYAKEATMLYMRQRLLKGEKHEDLKKILNEAVINSKKYTHYYQTANIDQEWPAYDWYNSAPGPMIKLEDFKEPNPWGP